MAIGSLIAGLPPGMPQVQVPPQQQPGILGRVGQALTGFGGRAMGLWDQIGKDPAATRAAQVLALSLLQGGGNWKRNLGAGGMAALNTYEGVKQQQATQAEKQRLEKKADQEKQQERADKRAEAAQKNARQVTEDLNSFIEYQDRQEALKSQRDYQNKSLELQGREIAAREKQGNTPNQTADEREQARVEGFLRQSMPNASDAQIYAAAKDVIEQRKLSAGGLDPAKMAQSIFEAMSKNVLPGDTVDYNAMAEQAASAATAFTDRFSPKGTPTSSRLDTLTSLQEAIKSGQVPTVGPAAQGASTTPGAPANTAPASNQEQIDAFLQKQTTLGPRDVVANQAKVKIGKVSRLPNGKTYTVLDVNPNYAVLQDNAGATSMMPLDQFLAVQGDFN